jgi:hypothetical protein
MAVAEASEPAPWIGAVDWEYVRQEVFGKGTTVKQIQREVAPEIGYVKFWRVFREKLGGQASPDQVTIRLDHKPAEKTQIDFCDGLWITEPQSGKKTLTQFFLGVLPFSSYTFGEFVLDQKLPTFIAVQQRMFAYLGGVTPYLVVDISRAAFTGLISTIPILIRRIVTLPITWALRSCRPALINRETRARGKPISEWFKEGSFRKSVIGSSIRFRNSTKPYVTTLSD